jgi:hydrogenase-4 component F
MTIVLSILLPALAAIVAFALPSERWRPWLLPPVGVAHLLACLGELRGAPTSALGGWLMLDPVDRLVLPLISVLFACGSFYAAGYLSYRRERSNRVFCTCLLMLIGAMSLTVWSHHLGLMWVGMEATTLCSAPLIYFNRTALSLEATWKFLLVGSVGIALALFGSFFLAYAALIQDLPTSLLMSDLIANAPAMSAPWLRAAFVLMLVGYGTKMGLAPMHTWKPDAYGEAPGLVGALFAGGVTSCAFLMITRVFNICRAAGEGEFARICTAGLGLLSLAIAAVFLIRQRDIKRMLAYSSVEHMGLLVLGLAVGAGATAGMLLHLVANALTKALLFIAAGNIHRAFGSKNIDGVSGAVRRLPLSGTMFVCGFLAITASPPFGPFVSTFMIIDGMFATNRPIVAAVTLVLLAVIFIGMARTVLPAALGSIDKHGQAVEAKAAARTGYRDGLLTGGPLVVLFVAVLMLGVYIPAPLREMLRAAAQHLEATP